MIWRRFLRFEDPQDIAKPFMGFNAEMLSMTWMIWGYHMDFGD
jgi:hypothetical protein